MTKPNISHAPITEWAALVPELDVSDLARSLDVYTRLFGFTVNYTRPGFAYLSLGRIQWMLSQIREGAAWETGPLAYPLGRGINFQIQVPDVQALYDRLLADGYPIFVPMETAVYLEGDTEHQQREFLVQDPDGYLLRFTD
ncbi:bleomycin resistance protein [Deinococcus arenicola]|uniref:Bleomycin resistance protein n=1 Tax=Deinococcus arenicola TaxID=2994950 RepID=A0ABU4DM07_9DEIO|nr:VOC family protein [Deinococcus sp. ZS9-10]MDV6373470.1 VOC family protein [Deinococcus sp. ZS9-10]